MRHLKKHILSVVLCVTLIFCTFTTFPTAEIQNELIRGDVNLDTFIKASDALLALKKASGKAELEQDSFWCADVDANNIVNTTDALLILQFSAGKIEIFPADWPTVEQPIYKKGDINSAVLEGLFTGDTTYTDVVTRIGGGMHFLDYIKVNGLYYCYYITEYYLDETHTFAVGLATSTDGINFNKYGIVFHGESFFDWDWRISSFPGIWYDNATHLFYLVYEGAGHSDSPGSVGLATSPDGKHFTRKGKILNKSANQYETVNVGTPDIFNYNGRWFVSYHGYNGNDCQICMAYGNDLFNLKKYPANPVIPTNPDHSAIDSGTTGRRDIIYYDGWFYMVYEVSGEQPYDFAKWGHKFARSKDMFNWETTNNIYPSTTRGMGNDGPSWLVMDGEVYVYMRAAGGSARYRLVLK